MFGFVKSHYKIFTLVALCALIVFLIALFYGYFFISPSFYQKPNNISSKIPGSIIRTEKVEQTVVPDANAWKILYTSTDFQTKKPIVVSGMVFIPKNSLTTGVKMPVVVWAHGTTGIATQCAPSLLLSGGAYTIPGLSTFIKSGYVVVATDYPGLGTAGVHPYLVGESEGYAVLDSMRAVLGFGQANAENKFVVWGHSQGGHASLFTGQLAKQYAPELNLVGVAATAPPTNLTRLFQFDSGTVPGEVLASLAFVSWSKLFENAKLSEILKFDAAVIAQNISSRCIDNKYAVVVDTPEANLFNFGFLSKNPSITQPWENILKTNSPTGATIDVPMIITQGTIDTVIDPKVTQAFVSSLCNEGKIISYHTLPNVGHIQAGVDSVPILAPWIKERFIGVVASSNCSIR